MRNPRFYISILCILISSMAYANAPRPPVLDRYPTLPEILQLDRCQGFICATLARGVFVLDKNLSHWRALRAPFKKIDRALFYKNYYYILADGQIFVSRSGQEWINRTDIIVSPRDLSLSVAGRLYAVDEENNIFYTDNSGSTWARFERKVLPLRKDAGLKVVPSGSGFYTVEGGYLFSYFFDWAGDRLIKLDYKDIRNGTIVYMANGLNVFQSMQRLDEKYMQTLTVNEYVGGTVKDVMALENIRIIGIDSHSLYGAPASGGLLQYGIKDHKVEILASPESIYRAIGIGLNEKIIVTTNGDLFHVDSKQRWSRLPSIEK